MSNKIYKYDGTEIFPKKIKTPDGYILTKVNDGTYENAFVPEYMNERGDFCVIPDVEKYEVIEESKKNDFRFYIYDFLIEQELLTIDTLQSRSRFDSFNIHGQCYSFGQEWDKITKATISQALGRSGYCYDEYIKEHFTDRPLRLENKVLFKSNDYNECIKFLADFGAKKHNYTNNSKSMDYYKKYLDIPENRIGEILEDGTVKKEYFQEGHIYKNSANFYRKEGICYISKYQTDKINKKSKPGEDYETYQTLYEKVKKYCKDKGVNTEKYTIKEFTETIFNDLNWQCAETLIIDSVDALDDEYFLDNDNELEE